MQDKKQVIAAVPIALVNWALATAGLFNLGAGTWRMFAGDATLASAGLAAGLVLLLAATIERFEFVKGLGIEAKTRELDKKIDQAEVILGQMKKLAEMSGVTLIQLAARAGRIGASTPAAEGYDLSRTVKAILETAGSSPESIRAALTPWATFAALDVTVAIVRRFRSLLVPVRDKLQQQVDRIPQPIQADDPAFVAALAELRAFSGYADGLFERIHEWPLQEFVSRLRAIAQNAPPQVPRQALEEFSAEVTAWAPQLTHLSEHLDFEDRARWMAAIAAAHKG